MKTKAGWVLSILVSGMFLFSASGKFMGGEDLVQGMTHLGMNVELAKTIGIIEVLMVALYLVPRAALIGAILITGYMGGAIFAHLRVGDPIFVQIGLPIVAWLGFGLRNFNATLRLFKDS